MSDKKSYIIFGITLIIFILVYIFVPKIEKKSLIMGEDVVEEFEPIYEGITNDTELRRQYLGNINFARINERITLMFIKHNIDILGSGLTFEEYYDQNKDEIKRIYGIENKEEFVELFNSFEKLGKDVYAVSVINESIYNDKYGIIFNIIVSKNANDEDTSAYKHYKCTIFNFEDEDGHIFKIEPYNNLIDQEVGA